jgi:hypothetical protein
MTRISPVREMAKANYHCRKIMDSEDNSHATSGDEWKPSEAASETDAPSNYLN